MKSSKSRSAPRRRPWTGVVLTTVALLAGGLSLTTPAAADGAGVTVTNEFGTATADTTYSTEFTVAGSGFQSIQGAFGGIYVLFGWVSDPGGDSWKPSSGGSTGITYRYVPDSEEKDNAGFQRFVSFPGSETEYAANGGVIAADGSWSLSMVVPGPKFQAYDRDNNPVDIDCSVVTCGIITVGAHGVVNANNETFTPIEFGDVYGDAGAVESTETTPAETETTTPAESGTGTPPEAVSDPPTSASSATTAPPTGAARPTDAVETTPVEPATADVDRATAVAGRVLSFFGRGFVPGEQILATLDDGMSSVGPLVAGPGGSLAGILQLPADLAAGTHVLRIQGAQSASAVEVTFPVRVETASVPATAEQTPIPEAASVSRPSASGSAIGFVVGAGVLLLIAGFFAVRSRLTRATEPAPTDVEGPA